MKIYPRGATIATALIAALVVVVPPAAAGGSFGLHIGSGGFGVSVGIGDWGPYTSNWTNPHWSLNFNTALSGYGEWMWVGGLGKVWRPGVAVGWRPYTHGRWVHTIAGWTWVAYEPWGYIPHHYGNWALCDFGWVWVPGYSYSCANVVWVRAGGYVGWYARPPRGWSHSAHGYRHGYGDGYRDGWYDARHATYVDWRHIGSDNVSHHAVRHKVASRSRIEDHAATPTMGEVRRRGGTTSSSRDSEIDNRLPSRTDKVPPLSTSSRTSARTTPRTRIGTTASPVRIERRFPERRSSAPDPSIRRSKQSAGSHDRRARIATRSRPATVQPKADVGPSPGKEPGDSKPRARRRISTKELPENRSTKHPGRRSR